MNRVNYNQWRLAGQKFGEQFKNKTQKDIVDSFFLNDFFFKLFYVTNYVPSTTFDHSERVV
jgi:hypothetical protein